MANPASCETSRIQIAGLRERGLVEHSQIAEQPASHLAAHAVRVRERQDGFAGIALAW
jgi:hypothetical protein